MKKILFLCAAMTAAMCFCGCNKDDGPAASDYFQVHFDANGATDGAIPEDMTIASGRTYKIPINITKKDSEFLCFAHKEPDGLFKLLSGEMDGQNYVLNYRCHHYDIKKDTLYFIWDRRKVTITYHANGASGEVHPPLTFDLPKYDLESHPYTYNQSTKSSLPDTVILDNGENLKYQDGYYFAGWNTKADGSGVFLPKGLKYINALDDVDLYAVFETHNGHEYVDLGLPSGTLWAKTNIGTTCEAGTGDLFAYGETAPKDNYTKDNWEASEEDNHQTMILVVDKTLRVGRQSKNYSGELYDFKLLYMQDAAAVNWGHLWRIPSIAEWKELFENCTVEDYDYVLIEEGITLRSKILRSKINGKYIILPSVSFFSVSDVSKTSIYKTLNANAETVRKMSERDILSSSDYKTDNYFSTAIITVDQHNRRQSWDTYYGEPAKVIDYWEGLPIRPVTKVKLN